MKKFLFTALFGIVVSVASAQTVENIQVEQDGEKLNIHYRIGGSTPEQLYFIKLTCRIDGGDLFEPKSVIGDVGKNIRGGKSFNTVIWNVYNDVDEVSNVEFFVEVDLESDESLKREPTSNVTQNENMGKTKGKKVFEKNIFIAYSGSTGYYNEIDDFGNLIYWYKDRFLGIRAGYLGNWGGYGTIKYGWDDQYDTPGISVLGGVTKHLIGEQQYRLHAYAGVGLGDLLDEIDFEAGLIGVVFNTVTLEVGIEVPSYFTAITFGIGVIF